VHQRVSEQVLLSYCKLAVVDHFWIDMFRESVSKLGSVYDACFLSPHFFMLSMGGPQSDSEFRGCLFQSFTGCLHSFQQVLK
jgi:hypothetical protein